MDRRTFVTGACASLIGAACLDPTDALADKYDSVMIQHKKAVITDAEGNPLKASSIKEGESFIFNYPYTSSPSFLINTGTAVGANGEWKGGVGAKKSIVAFVAVCPHVRSYAAKKLSPLAYRHKKEGSYVNKDHMVTCCSHGSVFDVDAGGKRTAGPAKAGLTAIVLEHDPATDTLTASASYGMKKLLPKFLKSKRKELKKIYGRSEYKTEVEGKTAPLKTLEQVSATITRC